MGSWPVSHAKYWVAMMASAPFDDEEPTPVRRMNAEEAHAFRRAHPQLSPWRVILWQMAAGCLTAAATGWVLESRNSAWSAAYGALVVVLPAALFARGLMGRLSSLNVGTAVAGFFFWEMFKIGLSLVLLGLAWRLVPGLHWPALLVGLVVTIKMYWVALLVAPKAKRV